MQLTSVSFFLLVIGCFILSSLSIKGIKIAIFAFANAIFLLSYSPLQLVLALVLSFVVTVFAKVSQNKQTTWIVGSLFIVGLLVLQRACTQFNLINIFGLMAFSYSGLKAIRYLKEVADKKVNNVYFICVFDYLFYFPSLLQGPIMDYCEFETVLFTDDQFNYKRRRVGFLQLLIGYTTRLVLVLALLPKYLAIFTHPFEYHISVKVVALVTFGFILYLDWDAYSNIVIGTSKALGMPISENFNAPLMAKDAKDFWSRWHISLSTFLRDFVYFPLGGSRCSNLRSYVNTIITFIVCGLWHGFNGLYLVWGVINGLAVCMVKPLKNMNNTFVKVSIGQLSKVIIILSLSVYGFASFNSYTDFIATLGNSGEITLGQLLTVNQWIVYGILISIYIIFDWCRYHFDSFVAIEKWYVPFRFIVYFSLIALIIICGVYGPGYDATNFIYQIF